MEAVLIDHLCKRAQSMSLYMMHGRLWISGAGEGVRIVVVDWRSCHNAPQGAWQTLIDAEAPSLIGGTLKIFESKSLVQLPVCCGFARRANGSC